MAERRTALDAPNDPPDPSAGQHSPSPRPVHPLGYEPPRDAPPDVAVDRVVTMLLRRVVFAGGVGLFVFGMVTAFAERSVRDAPEAAGWGAALIALVVPFPALWDYLPKGK